MTFSYTNGIDPPDHGGKVQLIAFNTVVFEIQFGTDWSGADLAGVGADRFQ